MAAPEHVEILRRLHQTNAVAARQYGYAKTRTSTL
jgi:hypothetical protein